MFYDSQLSVNQINNDLLNIIEKMEPYGKGNEEPQFLIKDIMIEKVKIIKNKHLLVFFKNDSKLSKHDKRIIQPNKNRGNNSPPAGKFRLSKPKNIDKQINDNEVK